MIIRRLALFVLAYATVINSQLVRMPVKKSDMKRSESHTAFRNLGSNSTKIYNYLNSQYTGTIKVGSNQKEFKVILDTGSSIFWIPDASAPHQFSHRYACSSSTTCQAYPASEYPISYEKGEIRGYKAVDQIKIGDMQIPKFSMLLVFEVEDMPGDNFDGILGLTLGRHYDEFPTLLQTLKRYGQIEVETFSMYLGDKPNSLEEATGEIIFGGYDPKYAASEFQFVQAYSPYKSLYWAARMTKIGYGDNLKSGNIPAMFDSGTSLLIMPQDYIEYVIQQAVAKGVKFSYDSENQLYMCSCNARKVLEDLVFDFDGVTLHVSAESYIIFDGGTCYLGMEPTMEAVSLNNPIILGDVLLKDYYLLYSANNNTIGFAKAVPTSNFPVYYTLLFIIGLVVMVGAGVYFWTKKCKHTRVTQTTSNTFGAFKSKGVVIGSSFSNELSSQYRYNPQRSEDNEARGNQIETREVPNYPPAS